MRTLRNILMCMALSVALSGCYVPSLNPFYTEETVIEYPSTVGEWECTKGCESGLNLGENWQFKEDLIRVVDKDGRLSVLTATFFRVGETVFLDTALDRLDCGPVDAFHVVPTHFLTRVTLDEEKETLTLAPLDYGWFAGHESAGLPYLKIQEEDSRVYTATREQWAAFIEEHHGLEEIYGEPIVLIRKKAVPENE